MFLERNGILDGSGTPALCLSYTIYGFIHTMFYLFCIVVIEWSGYTEQDMNIP